MTIEKKIKELANLLQDLCLDEIKDANGDIFNAYVCDEVTGGLIHDAIDNFFVNCDKCSELYSDDGFFFDCRTHDENVVLKDKLEKIKYLCENIDFTNTYITLNLKEEILKVLG